MTGPSRPHIGNLRKRAKALGFVITRTTTVQDAYDFGQHLYVIHRPNAGYMNRKDYSLWGIRRIIEDFEKRDNGNVHSP